MNTTETVSNELLATAEALEAFSDIDAAEGGNPHVIATERLAAQLLREAAELNTRARNAEPVGYRTRRADSDERWEYRREPLPNRSPIWEEEPLYAAPMPAVPDGLKQALIARAREDGPLFIEDIKDAFATFTPPAPQAETAPDVVQEAVKGEGFDSAVGGFSHLWIGDKKYTAAQVRAALRQPVQVDEAWSAALPLAVTDEMVEALWKGLLSCPHTIEGHQIVIRSTDSLPGNAAGQTFERLRNALTAALEAKQ